ncbi:MAG: hypothetical protein ACK45U_09590 [bacterium]|jgi:hypothetical protein
MSKNKLLFLVSFFLVFAMSCKKDESEPIESASSYVILDYLSWNGTDFQRRRDSISSDFTYFNQSPSDSVYVFNPISGRKIIYINVFPSSITKKTYINPSASMSFVNSTRQFYIEHVEDFMITRQYRSYATTGNLEIYNTKIVNKNGIDYLEINGSWKGKLTNPYDGKQYDAELKLVNTRFTL